MTSEEHQDLDRQRRLAGKPIIEEQARSQVRSFLDELKNGTTNYRTVASLGDQVAQEYRGRAVLELLQNAHDVLAFAPSDDPRQISFVLNSSPEQPELLIANSGRPFRREDFSGICQLGQSPKDPNESVGNKGLGFRSVLELTTRPEVWSTAPAGGDMAFTFGFDPDVLDPIARVAKRLFDDDVPTIPKFGSEPVVDWSDRQIEEYRGQLCRNGIEPVDEVTKYLSPYLLPRFLGDPPREVAELLAGGHVTVIRLPLDGGKAGTLDEEAKEKAVESVRNQLCALDEAAMVFLHHLSVLRITIDGEGDEFLRSVDPELPFPVLAARRERIRVARAGPEATDATERSFHVWSRTVGGDDHSEETKLIKDAVLHLPNRWPEVRTVEVAVSVEETSETRKGVYVVFLPTNMRTTVGAHINAPFYASLDRKQIDFQDAYNKLLLEFVKKLMRDAVEELVACDPEPWRGRAVMDLLAPVPDSSEAKKGPPLTSALRELGFANERPLEDEALILCDDGWRLPGVVRTMPAIPDDDPIGRVEWRKQAGFTVASSALNERREAAEALLRALGGSPEPKEGEWADTLARLAEWVGESQTEPAWNDFLRSAFAILPQALISEPREPDADPLRTARFLPASDGRLLSASDDVQVFFRPRHGADDAVGFVDSIPNSLKERIAFLHPGVKTLDTTQQRNTEVQKFLDGRFMRSFRREDLLRNVVIQSLPELPVAHGSTEATACAEILSWTLALIGGEEQEGLWPMLSRLPVACHDGWFAIEEAVFGPGWDGRCGNHLKTLADSLPEDGLLRCALLSPDDPRWGVGIEPDRPEAETADAPGLGELFERAGVVDGLRLNACEPIRFEMSGSHRMLPDEAPVGMPKSAWDDWKEAVRGKVEPWHSGWFDYDLRDVTALAPFHRSDLGDSARTALSNLILASLPHWEEGWHEVTIRKVGGAHFSQRITSPLKHLLSTLPWLDDRSDKEQALQQEPQPLRQRWLVPESLLRWQKGHFRHLSPLSLELAHRLAEDEKLLRALKELGLNVYPTEDDLTGPDLLEALAGVAKTGKPMPAGGFDVFLNQVRLAWRHFDPEREFPKDFVVRTKPRTFEVRTASELKDVYLPDQGANTRSLRDQGQPILAIRPGEANSRVGNRLHKLGARRASALDERCLIDDLRDTDAKEGAQPLDATTLGWLPVVLLALHAHGGGNPRGPATAAWRDAASRLGGVRIRQCGSIRVELVYAERIVATSKPRAHWMARDGILLLNRDILQRGLYEGIAAASQAVLDRQDLLKDLRLVLGSLARELRPTRAQIDAALEKAEIDSEAVADIRLKWLGQTAILVDRIRPVVKLLGVSDAGLDDAATDTARLTEWLSDRDLKWPSDDLLAAARRCHDDFEMGFAAWQELRDDAELPKWNEALRALGDEYPQVENKNARDETQRHLEGLVRSLRAFARHVATNNPDPLVENQANLFSEVNGVHEEFEMGAEWSRRWWEVPFRAVLDALRERYERILGVEPPQLDAFRNATTIEEFVSSLKTQGVTLEPDPLKEARENHSHLSSVVRSVWELHEAWRKEREADWQIRGAPEIVLDASMHLRPWSDNDVLSRAKNAFDSREFLNAVNGCETIDEIARKLGVSSEDLECIRKEYRRKTHIDERQKRVVKIGSWDHEVDAPESYNELFERLKQLHEPLGPRADLDEFTRLTDPPPIQIAPNRDSGGEITREPNPVEHLPPHLPELVGIVGEVHAFRFLESRFGIDENAWVSQFRTKVLPLRKGERGKASDSLGYDFRFTDHDGTTWCVEVKSTTEDGTSFDLTPGEVAAARRVALGKDERWRILRVRRALSEQPECDWLPNPFEPGAGQRLRVRQGSMTVEYAPSKSTEGD